MFTALSGLLLLAENPRRAWHVVAVISLSGSLALYIGGVYVYDQLGMPSGFWTDAGRLLP